jgi:HPt (histidine-containing phosphotransfer) domain-containing protein
MMTIGNASRPAERRLKILLIQPDDDTSGHIAAELAASGHLVIEANRSEDALRILRNRRVHLVLADRQAEPTVLVRIAASLRDANGRLSVRHTPIFLLSDDSEQTRWPDHIDGVVATPLDGRQLLATYLRYLSDSVNEAKRSRDMAPYCEIDAAIDRLGGDVELYKDLVDRFLDDSAGTRARVEAAIRGQDAASLRGAAHSLKGLASSVGASTAAATLGELEEQGLQQDLTSAAATWRRFETEMERTGDELAPYYRRTSPSLQ